MSRERLSSLSLTHVKDGSAWALTEAKARIMADTSRKLDAALRESRGAITLTLELYKEDT